MLRIQIPRREVSYESKTSVVYTCGVALLTCPHRLRLRCPRWFSGISRIHAGGISPALHRQSGAPKQARRLRTTSERYGGRLTCPGHHLPRGPNAPPNITAPRPGQRVPLGRSTIQMSHNDTRPASRAYDPGHPLRAGHSERVSRETCNEPTLSRAGVSSLTSLSGVRPTPLRSGATRSSDHFVSEVPANRTGNRVRDTSRRIWSPDQSRDSERAYWPHPHCGYVRSISTIPLRRMRGADSVTVCQ